MKSGFFRTKEFFGNQIKTYEIAYLQSVLRGSQLKLNCGGITHKAIFDEINRNKDNI